jgi:hypothetical protein
MKKAVVKALKIEEEQPEKEVALVCFEEEVMPSIYDKWSDGVRENLEAKMTSKLHIDTIIRLLVEN